MAPDDGKTGNRGTATITVSSGSGVGISNIKSKTSKPGSTATIYIVVNGQKSNTKTFTVK